MPTDADPTVVAPVGAGDPLATPTVDLAPVGQGSGRRALGLVGQYALLGALALLVVGPILFVFIQAISPPFKYVRAGKPFHPVGVQWQDRTWFTGGFVAVALRTLAVAGILGLVQYKAYANRIRTVVAIRSGSVTGHEQTALAVRGRVRLVIDKKAVAIRAVAVLAGTIGLALAASATFGSLYDRSSSTTPLVLACIAVVAITQAIGLFGNGRPAWSVGITALATGVLVSGAAIFVVAPDAWAKGWQLGRLGPALIRSLGMAVGITTAQVLTSLLAAYAFAFLRFPAKTLLFGLFMATLLLPLEVTLLANVNTIRSLGWIDTYRALIIPFTASAFGTFLIRQGFRGLPSELRDATRLDGYGHLSFLFKFAVPLTRPVIASFTVISALGAWNQYIWPRAVIDDGTPTAQITLRSVVGTQVTDANLGIAAALIVALPVVLLLIAFQKQIIRGLTAGAVKG